MPSATITPLVTGDAAAGEVVTRIRSQLLPIAQRCVGQSTALRQQFADAKAATQLLAVADRTITASRSLERLVSASLEPRAEAALATPAAQRRLRHDLRNPIAAVRGFVEILAEDAEGAGFGYLAPDVQALLATADETLVVIDGILDAVAVPVVPVPGERGYTPPGRVLVVDDDDSMRALLVQQLRRDGHEVIASASGEEALQLMRGDEFDAVLVDLNMPGLSGYDVLTRIVADPELRETGVIIVSSAGQDDRIVRCIEAGAIDYLVKPVKPVLLRARLAATLARKRLRDTEREHRARLELEKGKSDALLLNILPRQMVVRLSAGEDVIADAFDNVTVLFTDFVGFTRFAARLSPRQVVETLNRVFSAFDNLVLRLNVGKIKMIGDAYMAVAGLPTPRVDHAEQIAELALGMQMTLTQINPELSEPLDMRIGIATGPVVAGVIGTHKFAFDVWGHTVNMAARHESYCESGKIHVAKETEPLLRERYALQSRGILNIRGRGEVETFYLSGRKPR